MGLFFIVNGMMKHEGFFVSRRGRKKYFNNLRVKSLSRPLLRVLCGEKDVSMVT